MTDFKVKIGAKETVLDVQVIVLPLLNSFGQAKAFFHTALRNSLLVIPNQSRSLSLISEVGKGGRMGSYFCIEEGLSKLIIIMVDAIEKAIIKG